MKKTIKLKERFSKLNKYYNYNNIEYKRITDIKNLFGEFDDDYYKPIKNKNSAFNGNYIEYEKRGDKDKNLSPKEYLDIIKPYLSDMINDYKTQSEWKIKLTMSINFISFNDSDAAQNKHTKSDDTEIMIGSETDDIINKLFESLLQRYLEGLEEKMKGSDFAPDSVDLLYYHLHKISLKRGKSYVDSPKWLKNKKVTINPKNNDDKRFQCAIIAALNHEKIKNHLERISNLEPFIRKYEQKNINFQATSKDWKSLNKTIRQLLLISYLYHTILNK